MATSDSAIKQPSAASNRLRNIGSLFSLKKRDPMASNDREQAQQQSWQSRRDGESYHNYGIRICARVTASNFTFPAFLHKIFNIERQEQEKNKMLQEEYKRKLQGQINEIDDKISDAQGRKNALKIKSQTLNDRMTDAKSQLEELKADNGKVNKDQKIKLVIGCVIIAIMTLYLFIFYSSTFYSAFFKNFMEDGGTDIGAHMFDSTALPKSFDAGLTQLIFVLSAPAIFLGLGFVLHYASKESGLAKVLKLVGLVFVTFIFDCILAYAIANKIYEIWAASQLSDQPVYTIGTAMKDHNVWAVIFCGFIVYIIWGLLFDMTISAYEGLRSNKEEQNKVRLKIDQMKSQLADYQLESSKIQSEIDRQTTKKDGLLKKLKRGVLIDYGIIKVAINDFYAGWMQMMTNLGCSQEQQGLAQKTYETTITSLLTDAKESNEQQLKPE